MYLSRLSIRNFRKLKSVEVMFEPGLNILVGPNNVGKTTVIDALRALLNNQDEPSPRLSEDDIYRPKGGTPAGAIEFHYVFNALTQDDEADFLPALVPNAQSELEAHIHVRYSDPDKSTGRLRAKRWSGLHEENTLSAEMMEDLRGVYLPPLRDAAYGSPVPAFTGVFASLETGQPDRLAGDQRVAGNPITTTFSVSLEVKRYSDSGRSL